MYFSPRDTFIALALMYQGDWASMYDALRRRDEIDIEKARALIAQNKSKVLTYFDEEYPAYLKKCCPQPPFVLFYYGDISLIQDPTQILTVVGSREPSPYAIEKTHELCRGIIDEGYIVCSGLARGIDTAAAEATAAFPGKTIAVMGCGIDRCYPLENQELRDRIAKNGLLLSEYPGMVEPLAKHFPARNRFLAALAQGVLVGEAYPRSGTMITVAYALEMSRDVAALPFESNKGTSNNLLIKNGAALVENVTDLKLFLDHSCFKPQR